LPVRYSLLVVILLFATFTTGTIEQKATSQEVTVVTVDSTNLQFSPSTITISEGDAVRFFWSGELLAHNAVAEEGLFDSGDPSREVDYSFTFEIGTNGTYSYICEPHEAVGMVGTIIVEPAAPSITPEPDPDPMGEVPTKSGETWIPFFGLELVLVIMLIMVIYHFGRTQGLAETSLESPDSD
jgi:plastocyanin